MVFGFDPVKMVKRELLRIDVNKDENPDVFQALDGAEAGLAALSSFFDKFDVYEILDLLKFLNSYRKPGRRLSDEDLLTLAGKVALVAPGLIAAKAALEKFEEELRK